MIQHSENIQRAEEKVIDMTLLILSFSFTEIRGPSPPPPPPPRWFKERLLCLMYTVLIAKSLAYFCGLSLLGITRKKGRSTNSTPANWLSLNSFYLSITLKLNFRYIKHDEFMLLTNLKCSLSAILCIWVTYSFKMNVIYCR